MKPDAFEPPVTILTGLGIPTPVHSVMHAYRLLLDWPIGKHDAAHAVALRACKTAINGEIEPDTARSVFVAFAEKHDLLAPDHGVLVGARNRHGSDPHMR
ncbi:hypothetical protein ATY75_27735 [Rhizobium sp. N122]|uniref:DUF982 domain-containing protein n=1 Tax=Rhizobium sp. N122 TaxID=1764272 RepID=UPI000B5A8CE3|nr:DUF982 domain-containing protein [Rhizobium sp. N122]OWV81643.1 hypothetical protein ATY75_27735 [Rhizobium sp. N122]